MDEAQFIARLQASGRGDETLALIEKLGFKHAFILEHILNSAGTVNVAHIAMLWMGMPNKHDRKRVRQLLDALTEAGLLAFDASTESWKPKP